MAPSHTLPTRKRRLGRLRGLRRQRRWLVAAVAALVPITGALAVDLAENGPTVEAVPPGEGLAGVNAVPAPAQTIAAQSAIPESAIPESELPAPEAASPVEGGEASYYGRRFAGRPTASGERFDPRQLTAAHRTLPFGSRLRVTHARTGKSVVVRINDRGPFHSRRVIDLSRAAAERIGIVHSGRGEVRLELLSS